MIEKEMTLTKFYASILNLQRTKYLVSKSSLLPEKGLWAKVEMFDNKINQGKRGTHKIIGSNIHVLHVSFCYVQFKTMNTLK